MGRVNKKKLSEDVTSDPEAIDAVEPEYEVEKVVDRRLASVLAYCFSWSEK